MTLYEAAVERSGGRATVVAGTGTYATAHSVHLTEQAHELGVDGFLVVTPYYNKPPQRGIVAHVEAIAAATDRPVVFYDIPSRVVVDAEPATISRSPRSRTSAPSSRRSRRSTQRATSSSSGLDLYAGDDDLVLPFLEVGGVGGVCVHTHVVGPRVKEMITRYRAGDVEGARAIDEELRPSIELLRVQTNPIAIKTALNLLGHDVGGLRLPLVEADRRRDGRDARLPRAARAAPAARRVALHASPRGVRRLRERHRSGSSRSAASARSGRT